MPNHDEQPLRTSPVFRVAGYNLHGERMGWGPSKYDDVDPTPELDALDADVYVLSETWSPGRGAPVLGYVGGWVERNGLHIISGISYVREPSVERPEPEAAQTALATRLPVLEERRFAVPRHRFDVSVERWYVAARLELPGGCSYWQVAVHACSTVPFAPIANLRAAKPFLHELAATGNPVVLTGDFNLWGWWVRPVLRGPWRRAVRGRTWPAHRPHSQIDHILVPDGIEVVGAGVSPRGFSDHRAVWANLRLRSR